MTSSSDLEDRILEIESRRVPRRGGGDGCLKGCAIGCGVMALVIAVTVVGGVVMMRRYLAREWVAAQPLEIPRDELTPDEREALDAKLDRVPTQEAVDLEIEDRELNALIRQELGSPGATDPAAASVTFPEDDRFEGRFTMPFPGMDGYLNVEAAGRLRVQDGRGRIELSRLAVRGNPLPEDLGSELEKDLTNEGLPELIQTFEVEQLRISPGRVWLKLGIDLEEAVRRFQAQAGEPVEAEPGDEPEASNDGSAPVPWDAPGDDVADAGDEPQTAPDAAPESIAPGSTAPGSESTAPASPAP